MITIVVTFNKGKEYLEDCFASIKEQSYKDIETILVKDNVEENIDDLIEKYGESINLKTFELEKGEGVSAARNLGISKAAGEYIYILDSDDYLLEDTLEKIISNVKDDTELAYGQIVRTWFKREAFQPDPGDGEEDEESEDDSDDEDVKSSNVDIAAETLRYKFIGKISCLSVLYKREFLEKNHLLFDETQKYYADVRFWLEVLNNVDKYVYCEESMYIKRYHNDKINLPSISQLNENRDKYMAEAFGAALNSAGKNRYYIEKMISNFFVYKYARRFHSNAKDITKENFEDFCNVINKCTTKAKKEFSFTEKRIIKAGCNKDKKNVKKWNNIRLSLKKVKKIFTDKKHFYRTLNLYIFSKMKMKDNWIVFESFVGRNYSGQPKYIYKYMMENYGDKYKFIWSVDDKKMIIDGKCKKVKRLGLKYYYYMNRSKYWILNTRQPLHLPFRKNQVMLETWHGTPLKKLFFDMGDVHSPNPKYKERVFKQSRNWKYLLSDNPFSTDRFESCFMYDRKNILEYGYPANDPMYAKDKDAKSVKIKEQLGIPKDKKVLLYAPTYRDDISYEAGEYGFELALDLKRLKQEFGNEYVVLLRTHYWIVDALDLTGIEDFVINVSNYSDITDIYLVSDICMTDYSSVFFDFANLKRPVLFFMYDLDKYRDVLRGFYLDIEKELPGPILKDNDQVVDAIKNLEKINDDYKEKYEEFYNRFCCIDDGNAAKRVCEKVFKL